MSVHEYIAPDSKITNITGFRLFSTIWAVNRLMVHILEAISAVIEGETLESMRKY